MCGHCHSLTLSYLVFVLSLFAFVFEVVGLQPGEYIIQKPDSVETRIILNFKRPLNLEEDHDSYDDDDDDDEDEYEDEDEDEDEYLPYNVSTFESEAFESEDFEEEDDSYDDDEAEEDKEDEKVRDILRNKSTCIYTLPAEVVSVCTTSERDLKNLSISSCFR